MMPFVALLAILMEKKLDKVYEEISDENAKLNTVLIADKYLALAHVQLVVALVVGEKFCDFMPFPGKRLDRLREILDHHAPAAVLRCGGG